MTEYSFPHEHSDWSVCSAYNSHKHEFKKMTAVHYAQNYYPDLCNTSQGNSFMHSVLWSMLVPR